MKIIFKDVRVGRNGVPALDGIDFVFDGGKYLSYAVLGANGAGKSTLLETIVGIVSPSCGTVCVDGTEVKPSILRDIRRRVGMVFQDPEIQLFSQTVAEDAGFGPANLGLPAEEVGRRVSESLETMGIGSLAGRDVTRLSGGEKRRAAIAGILAMRPDAVLFDEPTAMLDPGICRGLADTFDTLPCMKIIATHDLAFALRTCAYSVILKSGKVFAHGETGKLLSDGGLLFECGLA